MITWVARLYIFTVRRSKYGPLIALLVLLLGLIGNSLAFMYFDGQSFGDSIWYSYISVTTIGYGDFYAVSTPARFANFVFIGLMGLGSFSYIIGWTIDKIATTASKRRNGMAKVLASKHILIVNFPNELRVKQIIQEVRSDDEHKDVEFVIISDKIDALPFDIPNVEFVKGSPIEKETFDQAKCSDAYAAFVLSTDYNDPQSDALVSTIVGVIENLCPEVITIAECLQQKHIDFFKSLGCDSVVCANEISTNLMVQEMQDHGVTKVFNVITSNVKTDGDTLFSAKVTNLRPGIRFYNDLAHAFVDRDGNLISVKRDGETKIYTNFPKDMAIQIGDVIVFTGSRRYTVEELEDFAQEYNSAKKIEA